MQLARRLWIAAACALALIVGSTAQAQSTKLLPNDTEMVVTINLQQILKSELAKSNKELVDIAKAKVTDQLEEKGLDKWLKKADFDVFKDLGSITVAVPGARNLDEYLIVIEGNFDAEKIEAAALEASKDAGGDKLKVIKIAGVKAFEVTPKEDKTLYVGILNKKTMIACATKADFAEAAARAKGDKGAQFKSPVFKGLMQSVNAKQSISIVTTSNMMLKFADKAPAGAPNVDKVVDNLKKLDGFSAAITVSKNIDLEVGVNTKDADSASQFAAAGNIGLGLLKGKVEEAAKNDPKAQPAVDILKTVRITSQGPILTVRGQISADTLDKLIKMIPLPN
jgi:hypothetical protein